MRRYFNGACTKTRDSDRNRENVYRKVAQYILRRKTCGTIMDVGCGSGAFLSRWFATQSWQKLGIDLSGESADISSARGIQILGTTIGEAKLESASVDVVTALDSFFYSPDPRNELAEIHRALKQDGLLILDLPTAVTSLLRLKASARLKSKIFLAKRDHLFYYSPRAARALLEDSGFRVLEILPLPANRQDHWLREALYRVFGLLAATLRLLTGSRIFIAPRFLLAAEKKNPPVVSISEAQCGKPS